MRSAVAIFLAGAALGLSFEEFIPPAADRLAVQGPNGSAILPGGRVIQPFGLQFPTGPGPFAIAATPLGKVIATANLGPERASISIVEGSARAQWTVRNVFAASAANDATDFHSLSGGIAPAGEKSAWFSEGSTGRIRLIDFASGETRRLIDLDAAGPRGSFSGNLAFDASRDRLFVADPAHARVVVVDARHGSVLGTIQTRATPYALSLSPDSKSLWITVFGSTSESPAVGRADVSGPGQAVVPAWIDLGPSAVAGAAYPGAPSAVLATSADVYVSDARNDLVYVIDPASNSLRAFIPIRIPALGSLRGVIPMGLAWDESRKWLLVAEAGINAVGLIDSAARRVLGHVPTGWVPTSVAVRRAPTGGVEQDQIFVGNARGRGAGPSSIIVLPDASDFAGVSRRGSISEFTLPAVSDLPHASGLVFAANGFQPSHATPPQMPPVQYVVLIVKEDRSFDEVFGDLKVAGQQVNGVARLARFGSAGYAEGGKNRFSLQRIDITPNQHALARRFTSSDNFYADSDSAPEGLYWLSGEYLAALTPLPLTAPDPASLWRSLDRAGVSYRIFEPVPGGITDQDRATSVVRELEEKHARGQPLPRLIVIRLPADGAGEPKPAAGYPYTASYVADNDVATGRIVAFLSRSPWWAHMAIFITEASASGGRDHVDAHRTLLLAAGPYCKRGYVSHRNASFPALVRSILSLLGAPSLNLFDASAADLSGIFTAEPDLNPYDLVSVDDHLFDTNSTDVPTHLKQ